MAASIRASRQGIHIRTWKDWPYFLRAEYGLDLAQPHAVLPVDGEVGKVLHQHLPHIVLGGLQPLHDVGMQVNEVVQPEEDDIHVDSWQLGQLVTEVTANHL